MVIMFYYFLSLSCQSDLQVSNVTELICYNVSLKSEF